MQVAEYVANMIGGQAAEQIRLHVNTISEIRIRANRPVFLRLINGEWMECPCVHSDLVRAVASRLMKNSLYACENELREGYFTTEDGCRVGVCGTLKYSGSSIASMGSIASLCIRIPREIQGAADGLLEYMADGGLLILSPPGMGKTTVLRDVIRRLSDGGACVAVADERREIAACREGIPQLNVGKNTDVLDGCPKAQAISMLVRACAPDVIAADEIGSMEEARALLDAHRCGIRIIATAHGSIENHALQRDAVAQLMQEGIFDSCGELGPVPGKIRRILRRCNGGYADVEILDTDAAPAGLHRRRKADCGCVQGEVRTVVRIDDGHACASAEDAEFPGTARSAASKI